MATPSEAAVAAILLQVASSIGRPVPERSLSVCRSISPGKQHFNAQQTLMRSRQYSVQLQPPRRLQYFFRGFRADIAALIQHPVDGGNANRRELCNVLKPVFRIITRSS